MQLTGILEWGLRTKHSLPESFKFFSWQCLPKASETIYYELAGGICEHRYKSGPRKGRPRYDKATDTKTFYVTKPESLAFEREYIEATGNCSECMGEGKTVASVGVNGTTYRDCKVCNGTGASQHTMPA